MELEWVDWLRDRLPQSQQAPLGLIDDAALLPLPSSELLVTTDVLIDQVHFRTGDHTPRRIGHKSLAVNLSDLAAMGAKPLGAVVGLVLPREGVRHQDQSLSPRELAEQLYEGILPLAERYDCPIVGGDTNLSDGPLTVAITAMGTPGENRPWQRSGASPGDLLAVTGPLGGSLLAHHLDFEPRLSIALALNAQPGVHAAIDLTDGLALDLDRMLRASSKANQPVGAVIDVPRIPISSDAHQRSHATGHPPLEHALQDGEDFELLLAIEPDRLATLKQAIPAGEKLTVIGHLTDQPGAFLHHADGPTEPLLPKGYEHR